MIEIILFDYDSDKLSGRKFLKDGLGHILFSISKFLKIKHSFFNKYYTSCDEYALTILKINKLLGIKTIVGIKTDLDKRELIDKLKGIDESIDIRIHIHIGENDDLFKKRIWIPPLNQSKYTLHFEDEYCNDKEPKLNINDIPTFHFDNPHHLQNYIDFIYKRYINYKGDYEIVEK